MGSNAKAQAARHAAFKRFIDEDPIKWQQMLSEEYEARGLVYKPRLSAEERKARDDADKKAKAEAQILRLAQKNGIPVVVGKTEAEIEREAALDARSEAEEAARDATDQA